MTASNKESMTAWEDMSVEYSYGKCASCSICHNRPIDQAGTKSVENSSVSLLCLGKYPSVNTGS